LPDIKRDHVKAERINASQQAPHREESGLFTFVFREAVRN